MVADEIIQTLCIVREEFRSEEAEAHIQRTGDIELAGDVCELPVFLARMKEIDA